MLPKEQQEGTGILSILWISNNNFSNDLKTGTNQWTP